MPQTIDRTGVLGLAAEGATVIEVLPREEFEAELLRGAVNIPLKKLDGGAVADLERASPVVVYCWDVR
jgi:rhodanese-related sulfurtransferase